MKNNSRPSVGSFFKTEKLSQLLKPWICKAMSYETYQLYSLDCGITEMCTLGSMLPTGCDSRGLVKLRNGWVGLTQAVGIFWLLHARASSVPVLVAEAPGTGPTVGTCSPDRAEEPRRRGVVC